MGVHCLITGADGYIGRALLPTLAAQGHQLSAQCRPGTLPAFDATNVRIRDCDFGIPDWELALDDVDVVFHLAGVAHQQGNEDVYQRINVDATVVLAEKAKAAGVRRFVFVSSVKAALAQRNELSELLPLSNVDNPYAQSKALAEEGLRESCEKAEMELLVVRPALVYSEHALGHLHWLRRWTELHLPKPPPGGERSMIALADLTRLLTLLAVAPVADLSLLTVTDGQRYSAQRLHAALCVATRRRPWLPSPPKIVWKGLSRLVDAARGEVPGRTWSRITAEDCYPACGMDTLEFVPAFDFETSCGAGSDAA